jgi:hypothetical protein
MTIRETLEHAWIQKFNKTPLPEFRRKNRNRNYSDFKFYTSTDEV